MPDFFSPDRRSKYGYGVLRLGLLLAFTFLAAPRIQGVGERGSLAYPRSYRWLGHAYIGAIGAVVNVSILSFWANLALLLGAAAFCVADVRAHGPATLVYLLKTMCGDFLAGKLDTKEWKLVLLFALGLVFPAALWMEPGGQGGLVAQYARVFLILFVVQLVCELGDAHWESLAFFRHRYSFELATLLLLTLARLQPHELLAVQVDLVACWFYRLANFALCMLANDALSQLVLECCFRLHFWRRGIRMVRVRDPEVAKLVIQQSVDKGEGLERYVASPAWAPVLSLESIDGDLWREMRSDFNRVLRMCPPASKLHGIAKDQLDALVASGRVIDAEAMSRLSAEVFIEYLFGRKWCPEFQVFVDASWEWRKEIAVRGRGDMRVKLAAIRCLTDNLLPQSPFWGLFGDAWRNPRYYSLFMQPFLISPCINVSDVAVAFKLNPGASTEEAVREMHPFPIFERYVERDVVSGTRVVVPAHSSAVMFTADFDSTIPWPIFGSGQRACAGAHLMLPFLQLLQSTLVGLPQFQPELNHRFSGRNNDAGWSLAETVYFVRTLRPLLF